MIAIAFGLCDKFEFNSDSSKKGYEFLSAFYEWDSNYFVNEYGLEREIIEEGMANNYILWRIYGKDIDTYFLFGEESCKVKTFSVSKTDKWNMKEKITFLKDLFLASK